jgi:release factor glutamine methyltransferase
MMTTGRDVVETLLPRLEQAGVAEARVKLEWLVCETLQVGREALDTLEVDATTPAALETKITRLERHEPLQYVLGHAPFLECSLLTDPRALIPRPETEELAMRVLRCGALWSRGEVNIADVGTGTGCLAITFAIKHPAAKVMAIDVSADALKLARDNARRNQVAERIEFRLGDLLEGVALESLDAVVSNPPYIATDVLATLDVSVRDFEPLAALYGGEDGLEVIRRLIPAAFAALKADGHLFLEIGDEQGEAVRGLLEQAGFREIDIARDMYGNIRFAEAIK